MSSSEWNEFVFSEFVEINPTIRLDNTKEYSFVEMKDLEDGKKYATPSTKRKVAGGARFENMDTLFARITPCLENGKISQAAELENGVGFGSTEFLVFRGKKEISDPQFVYYLSRSNEVRKFAEQNLVGTSGRQRVGKEVFQKLTLNLPSLKTQRRIASILSSLDDKIELNRQTNQTLEAIAQALFKEWFVDFNYPGATGEMVDSELGDIPTGWRVGTLGEAYKTTSGGTPSRTKPEYYESGTVPWVKSKELNNSFIIKTEERITEVALKNSSAKLLPKHTVLIAMYGATVGEIGITSIEASCNQAICAFLPNESYPYTFIYQFLKNNKEDIISRAVGSAQQNISQDLLKKMKIVLPSIELIGRYHRVASDLFEKIENNLFELETLTDLRDALLPKLMKGEIKIN